MAGTLGVVLLGWMGKSMHRWNTRAVMVNVVAGTISIFIQMKIGGLASLLNKHNVVGRQGILSTMVALSIVSLLVVRVPVVLLYKMVTQSNSSIAIIQVAIALSFMGYQAPTTRVRNNMMCMAMDIPQIKRIRIQQ